MSSWTATCCISGLILDLKMPPGPKHRGGPTVNRRSRYRRYMNLINEKVKPNTIERVSVYIDGFNLYHAICDLNEPHLKWVNLQKLSNSLIDKKSQKVICVKYFSAFANHLSNQGKHDSLLRHRAYLKALQSKGVECIMGNFAKRDLYYAGKGYRSRWRRHEEKQTDVAIALHLLRDAYDDHFDRALLISLDTDMLPLFDIFKSAHPHKIIECVAPPERRHHREIVNRVPISNIRRLQIMGALFGKQVVKNGKIISKRPPEYTPPNNTKLDLLIS